MTIGKASESKLRAEETASISVRKPRIGRNWGIDAFLFCGLGIVLNSSLTFNATISIERWVCCQPTKNDHDKTTARYSQRFCYGGV